MKGVPASLLTALTFYSRYPVPPAEDRPPLTEALAMAPVAGVLVALPAALLMLVASLAGASPLLCAGIAVVAAIIVTGALHEDGLADCADGFWGGSTPPKRLAIMRDSRIGTFGVLALVSAVLLKAATLQTAVEAGALFAALTLLGGAAAARAVALYPFVALPPAREDGLAVAVGRPTVRRFRQALVIAIVIAASLTVWWAPLGLVVAGVATAAVVKAVSELSHRKIGGHTGDVIGASVVLADLTYIATLTMWTV